MNVFKYIKYFLSFLLVSVVIVSQQNCSPSSNSFSNGADEKTILAPPDSSNLNNFFENQGNGDGYSGKAAFYAPDSSGLCSASNPNHVQFGSILVYALIEVDYLIQTATLQVMGCEVIQPQVLDPRDIQTDDGNSSIIYYNNLIFYAVPAGTGTGQSGG